MAASSARPSQLFALMRALCRLCDVWHVVVVGGARDGADSLRVAPLFGRSRAADTRVLAMQVSGFTLLGCRVVGR